MARVPFIDPDAPDALPEVRSFAAQFLGKRGGRLINIYRTLLHSPDLAQTWFGLINAVRWGTTLDGRLREILIIRIGHLNSCAYIVKQHVPRLAAPEGLSQADCDAIADWRPSTLFAPRERAALAYADAMTREIAVGDEIFAALKPHFNHREIVEMTVLVGTYNMHSRVVRALDIDVEKD